MPVLTTFIQNSFGSPGHSNQRKKEIKEIRLGKEVKLSLFADDTIPYRESPKDATRKSLDLSDESSKVAKKNMNTQKALRTFFFACMTPS